MSKKRLSHSIVLGGSAAGLLAARVLADNAERVTLVERDPLPDAPVHRKGTPQSRHANNVLPRAAAILEEWFPGIVQELRRAGAVSVSDAARIVIRGIRYARTRGAPATLLLTRPLLDAALRARVSALPNVTVLSGTEASGLITDAKRNVAGVYLDTGSGEQPLKGDLVVDAMGRGSRGRSWLAALGYEPPDATEISVNVHYSTRLFERGDSDLNGDHLVLISPTVDNARGAVAFAVEDGRWLVTLFAYGGVRPARDLAGFRDFAASLAADDIAVLVSRARPVDEGFQFGYPSALLRRYDRLRALPDGYIALGDSLCQLNPSYGQGITSAALQAQALGRAVAARATRLPQRYYRLAVASASAPFELSWSSDLDLPWVSGPPSPTPAPIRAYVQRAMRTAANDATVATAIRRVIGLIDPPPALLRPRIAFRVFRSPRESRVASGYNATHAVARPAPAAYADPEATRSLP